MLDKYLNKITCGDSYSLIKDIPDKSIDLIYTDIPYDIEDNGGGGCFGEKKRDYHAEYEKVCENSHSSRIWYATAKSLNGLVDIAYGIDWSILDEFCRVLKAINIYIWCSKAQILPLMQYFVGERECRFEILTWHKTNPIPTCNNKYLSDTEYLLLFRQGGANTRIRGTFEQKSKYYISSINVEDKTYFEHPTIKPLPFVKNHILNSTEEKDIVLDPFCGSGTTCVAAKQLNRQFIGIEIEPKWAKVAQDRLDGIDAHGQMSMFLR